MLEVTGLTAWYGQAQALHGTTDPVEEHAVGVQDRAVPVQPQEGDGSDVPGVVSGRAHGTGRR